MHALDRNHTAKFEGQATYIKVAQYTDFLPGTNAALSITTKCCIVRRPPHGFTSERCLISSRAKVIIVCRCTPKLPAGAAIGLNARVWKRSYLSALSENDGTRTRVKTRFGIKQTPDYIEYTLDATGGLTRRIFIGLLTAGLCTCWETLSFCNASPLSR